MTMLYCTHCGRRLIEPTVTIRTKRGPLYWGPKCAQKAGLSPGRRARSKQPKPERAIDHTGQMDWVDDGGTT